MGLKEDLSRPDAYPELRPAEVHLEATHISWVFLLERDVFKVKRPVDFGFLDFRTIDQRRVACEAEITLNARLSDGVYLGVVAVRAGADGRARIGGSGAIVDYAVHMRRLPDEHRADDLLARGQLANAAIEAIAARVARFHAAARCDETTSRHGTRAAIARNVEENFAQTKASIGDYLQADEAHELVRWQTAFVRGHGATFERRIAEKRVRDGHGDLRLEHVYLDGRDAPTIIDCIEFNDRFRFADVCADVAFLSMDLAAHGRVDLAERFLARYAREADDFDLYEVVDFYESYRAFVRGKVAIMVANDDDAGADGRRRAVEVARRSFMLSLSADRRSLIVPALIAVGGVIASGKSTIAHRLGDALGAPVIDADRTRKAMLGVEATHHLDEAAWSGAYDPAMTARVYAEMLRRAAVVLASGRPVVLDASFRSRGERHSARELAETHNAPFRFVECLSTPEICRARLAKRAHDRGVSDGRLAIFDAFLASYEAVVELASCDHVVVDTSNAVEDSMAILRSRIDAWPRGFVA